jgi:pimeloyl-ACP methyl ester carboxylesterase
VLVGHSYGGAVITEAGRHQDVAALVYIAAFVPDKDESVNALIGGFPADGPQPPLLPPRDGFLLLDQEKFPPSFAGDVPAEQAVTCGLTMNWGSGPVEGRVNHITMIKRQMFGRAGLPLLRKRVLLTAQS